jgi:hypothetical protein
VVVAQARDGVEAPAKIASMRPAIAVIAFADAEALRDRGRLQGRWRDGDRAPDGDRFAALRREFMKMS